jgi:hypothetical protein
MREFGVELSPEAIKKLLANKSIKRNGVVTLDEFLELMTPWVRQKAGVLLKVQIYFVIFRSHQNNVII